MGKAALDNMVKWLSQELMSDDIRVNGICPGLIATEFSGVLWKEQKDLDPKKVGQSHHIGAVCATICSEKDGGFMNGESYQVHGGFPKL